MLDFHCRSYLGMASILSDPAPYAKYKDGKVDGVFGIYVDSTLRDGSREFQNMFRKTNDRFQMGTVSLLPIVFIGFKISKASNQTISLRQHEYIKSIRDFPEDESYKETF